MSEIHFPIQSGKTYQDLLEISGRLQKNKPMMFDALVNRGKGDPGEFERWTAGLILYLKNNESDLSGLTIREVALVQRDIVNLLSGHLAIDKKPSSGFH